jgi:hypothetical protein
MTEDPGERQWRALMARYGPPKSFRLLTDEERRAAVRERRALAMTMWRDGFGGGSVGCSLLEIEDPEPGGDDVHRGVTVYVAFPRPCRLTPEIVRNLRRNWWEDLREVPFGDDAS